MKIKELRDKIKKKCIKHVVNVEKKKPYMILELEVYVKSV